MRERKSRLPYVDAQNWDRPRVTATSCTVDWSVVVAISPDRSTHTPQEVEEGDEASRASGKEGCV